MHTHYSLYDLHHYVSVFQYKYTQCSQHIQALQHNFEDHWYLPHTLQRSLTQQELHRMYGLLSHTLDSLSLIDSDYRYLYDVSALTRDIIHEIAKLDRYMTRHHLHYTPMDIIPPRITIDDVYFTTYPHTSNNYLPTHQLMFLIRLLFDAHTTIPDLRHAMRSGHQYKLIKRLHQYISTNYTLDNTIPVVAQQYNLQILINDVDNTKELYIEDTITQRNISSVIIPALLHNTPS